jgi:hypothetical protein
VLTELLLLLFKLYMFSCFVFWFFFFIHVHVVIGLWALKLVQKQKLSWQKTPQYFENMKDGWLAWLACSTGSVRTLVACLRFEPVALCSTSSEVNCPCTSLAAYSSMYWLTQTTLNFWSIICISLELFNIYESVSDTLQGTLRRIKFVFYYTLDK